MLCWENHHLDPGALKWSSFTTWVHDTGVLDNESGSVT